MIDTNKIKNTNDLVYAITERVKELADQSMIYLRIAGGQGDGSLDGIHKHSTRGDIIAAIIDAEFIEEFPPEVKG